MGGLECSSERPHKRSPLCTRKTNKWRRAELIFSEKKLVYAEAEGTQVKCIADPMNGVLLNVATIEDLQEEKK